MGGKSEQRTIHKPPHRIYLIFFHPTDSRGQMPRTTSSFDEGGRCVGKFHETVSSKGRRSHNKVSVCENSACGICGICGRVLTYNILHKTQYWK